MFKTKATTSTTPTEGASCCSSSAGPSRPQISTNPTWAQLMSPKPNYLSPENMHHPAHTSPHVHKTKLYSPYSTSGHSTPRHGMRRESSHAGHRGSHNAPSSSTTRPPLPRIRPISDMNKLLGAVFREDGSVNEQIPRSALGLPGIKTFDTIAESGGVKIEPMEMEVDLPIQFPTNEDVVIGACCCGDDCDCPDCATHGNPSRTGEPHRHTHGCGEHCKSSFDCSDQLSLPRGITSIGHLLSIAAANVPPPAQRRPLDLNAHAHDTRVLPPAARINEDAARSLGLVTLKPLECCNGRCQCPPDKCVCEKECCGCCIRCACDEDGDSTMRGVPPTAEAPSAKSCCSTSGDAQIAPGTAARAGSACGSSTQPSSPAKSHNATPPLISPGTLMPPGSTPPLPSSAGNHAESSRQPSPHPPGTAQAGALRRASSTSQGRTPSAPASRRATITQQAGVQRSGSTGKQASKALALHTTPNHPHAHTSHRPILPKPPSQGSQLGVPKSGNPSRVPSPGAQGHRAVPSSAQHSAQGSPSIGAVHNDNPAQALRLPEAVQVPSMVAVPSLPDFTGQQSGPDFSVNNSFFQQPFDPNLDQIYAPPSANDNTEDYVMDDELIAFINQFTAENGDSGMNFAQPPSSSEGSVDQPLVTPDMSFDNTFDLAGNGSQGGRSNGTSMDATNAEQDFFTMLSNAMQNTSNNTSMPQSYPQPTSSAPNGTIPPSQHINAHSQQMPPMQQPVPSQNPDPWSSTLMQQRRSGDISNQAQPLGLGVRSPLHLGDETDPNNQAVDNTGFAVALIDLFVGQQNMANASASQEQAPAPIYRQLPPQQTAYLQQMLGANPAFSPSPDPSDSLKVQQPPASNMIDLSKPLNAHDVERILKALQDQQAKTATSPSNESTNGNGVKQAQQAPPPPSQPQLSQSQVQQQVQAQMQFAQRPPVQQPVKGAPPPQFSQAPNGLSYDMASMNPFGNASEELFEKYLSDSANSIQGTNPSQPAQNGFSFDSGLNGGESGFDFSQLWNGTGSSGGVSGESGGSLGTDVAGGVTGQGDLDPRLQTHLFAMYRQGLGM